MIILVWMVSILVIACVIGEVRFRQLRVLRSMKKSFNIQDWRNDIDENIDSLAIESTETEFIPTTKLEVRGSWRLAQDSMMDIIDFEEIKKNEYNKFLH